MTRGYVNALVLRNDGDTAILIPQDGSDQEITFRRGEESLEEFLQLFPLKGMVQISHEEPEHSSTEEKQYVITNWITVKILSNDGEEAFVRFPSGEKVRFYRGDGSRNDFLKAWPPGNMAEFQILDVEHGVSNPKRRQLKGRRNFAK